MESLLNSTGIVLQIAGVLVTGAGAWKTWHEFAPEGDRFLSPLSRASRAAVARIQAFGWRLAWMMGRRRRVVMGAGGTIALSGEVRARGRMQFRTLPKSLRTRESLDELDQRTHQLMEMVSDARDRTEDEAERAEKADSALDARIDGVTELLDERTTRVAIGGVRLEAAGLVLIALGLSLQAVAPLFRTASGA